MADFIRRPYEEIPLTQEQVMEFARLMKRPNGVHRFAHYVEIGTADGPLNFGSVIKDFQHDMLDLMQNNERSILLASRQMSKCVTGDSMITVRNDKTSEEMEISIEEFHELQKSIKTD